MIFNRDIQEHIRKIEYFGNWAIGRDSRKEQTPYLSDLQKLISELPADPVIGYWLKKFLDEVPRSTSRSIGHDSSCSFARSYLSNLISEVSSKPWENSTYEERQKKAGELFISE
ncbi:MAG: hypothetical protein LBH14_08240 [Desulfobulbaceae bacterium]|nr:hypothetical protein [Desulfobulbaceae bacterium]